MHAEGVLVKGVGGNYEIMTAQGRVLCKARGRFRKDQLIPVVGDRVEVLIGAQGNGRIEEIMPRKNQLIRPPVSNIDRLFVVTAASSPEPDFFLLDKIIVSAFSQGIEVSLCVNKIDTADPAGITEVYRKAGFPVYLTCAKEGTGVDAVREALMDGVTAFAGASGVGKSSLLNAIDKRLVLQTSDISEKIERGRHTTRHVELFQIAPDTYVFDTPGFSSFEVLNVKAKELIHYYPDLMEHSGECPFSDCSHTREEECAVRRAVREGKISASRWESYQALYEKLKEVKEWEK
jgi:ribosome biogenesis GTPase